MPDKDDKLIFEAYSDNNQQITRAAEFALQAIKEIDNWFREQEEELEPQYNTIGEEEFNKKHRAILAELHNREKEAIKKVIAEHMPEDPYDNETFRPSEALFMRLAKAAEPSAEVMGDPLFDLAVHMFGEKEAADQLGRISQIAHGIGMF